MRTTTETPERILRLAAPSERHVAAWRAALGLDRGRTNPGRFHVEEVRYAATSDRTVRPEFGANAKVWKRALATRRDSTGLAYARPVSSPENEEPDIAKLRDWLLSDSLDWDAIERARDEDWR
jgi:hypothetical protein